MGFRAAAVLALGLPMALAGEGGLRGGSLNITGNTSAPLANATRNTALEVGNATAALLNATGLGAPEADWVGDTLGAENSSQVGVPLPADMTLAAISSGAGGRYYWDNQCTPCPAHLYRHCSRGGWLVHSRPCGQAHAYCEGLCTSPPQPTTPRPQPTRPPRTTTKRHEQPTTPRPQPTRPPRTTTKRHDHGSDQGGHHDNHGQVMTLYHMTSPSIAEAILQSGFKPGHAGWCGGAIYFFSSPNVPKTKLGPDSHSGAVIEAKVDMGRMAHLDSKCSGHDDARSHHDSITFNPGDGAEFVVFSNSRVLSTRRYN